MSAEVKLGLDAASEDRCCRDSERQRPDRQLKKAAADLSTRDNKGWRATVGTLKDASIEFTVHDRTGDTAFGVLQSL